MANTAALLDASGQVEAQYKYTAFGEVAAVSVEGGAWSAVDWPTLPAELSSHMLAGGRKQYYLDPETELYLLGGGNNGRYYDPATTRFLSEDPIRQKSGDPNLFPYVQNDPVNKLDPSGHDQDQSRPSRQEQQKQQIMPTMQNGFNEILGGARNIWEPRGLGRNPLPSPDDKHFLPLARHTWEHPGGHSHRRRHHHNHPSSRATRDGQHRRLEITPLLPTSVSREFQWEMFQHHHELMKNPAFRDWFPTGAKASGGEAVPIAFAEVADPDRPANPFDFLGGGSSSTAPGAGQSAERGALFGGIAGAVPINATTNPGSEHMFLANGRPATAAGGAAPADHSTFRLHPGHSTNVPSYLQLPPELELAISHSKARVAEAQAAWAEARYRASQPAPPPPKEATFFNSAWLWSQETERQTRGGITALGNAWDYSVNLQATNSNPFHNLHEEFTHWFGLGDDPSTRTSAQGKELRAAANERKAEILQVQSGYDQGDEYHGTATENRIVGASNAVGALSGVILAAPTVVTPMGFAAEFYLLDQVLTGVRQTVSGKIEQSSGSQAVQAAIQATGIEKDPNKAREEADLYYNLAGLAVNLKNASNMMKAPAGLPELPPVKPGLTGITVTEQDLPGAGTGARPIADVPAGNPEQVPVPQTVDAGAGMADPKMPPLSATKPMPGGAAQGDIGGSGSPQTPATPSPSSPETAETPAARKVPAETGTAPANKESGRSETEKARQSPALTKAQQGAKIEDEAASQGRVDPRVQKEAQLQNPAADRGTVAPTSPPKLTPAEIPTYKSGKFEEWFDKQTPEQLREYWKDENLRAKIKNELLGPGGEHEYLMRATAPKWKEWGVTARELREKYSVPIDELNQNAKDWTHTTGPGTPAEGSKRVHNELQKIINNSKNIEEFKKNLIPWAQKNLKNGVSDLPKALK